MKKQRSRIGILETFGVTDPEAAAKDAAKAIFGKGKIPPTKLDLTSTRVFKPKISIPTWLGVKRYGRDVPIYNLFNRNLPSMEQPFSVKVRGVQDFLGGEFTYESHMGTDFAIPVGTHITTCAPGRVMDVVNNLDHGGLKIFVDHGKGLVTTYGHLSRSLVEAGDVVGRGDSLALSGAAGIELIIFFPWVAPHLHLNVLLNGIPEDPFALEDQGEIPMWRTGNDPVPHSGPPDTDFRPTEWNPDLLDRAIAECVDPEEQEHLRGIPDLEKRAVEVIIYRTFYGPLFRSFPPLYEKEYLREPVLDLPFRAQDYDGVRLPES